ncbi:MAG: YdcF family protein [Rhizobiaceae bacterium]
MTANQQSRLREATRPDLIDIRRTNPFRRLSRWIAGITAAVLLIACAYLAGFVFFANHVANLKTPTSLPRADSIIVLTGGQARLKAATSLLQAGKAERLLISGVHPSAREQALRSATGAGAGLFDCCIDIDRVALDTIGNAAESAKWLRSNGYSSAIIVTNNYHMPRSLMEFERLVIDAKLVAYPVVNSDLAGGGWLTEPDALRVLFTEYGKYVMALARGG